MRGPSTIYYIDGTTSEIIYRISGKKTDFEMGTDATFWYQVSSALFSARVEDLTGLAPGSMTLGSAPTTQCHHTTSASLTTLQGALETSRRPLEALFCRSTWTR